MNIAIFHASAGHGHQKVAEVIAHTFYERGLSSQQVLVRDALMDFPLSVGKIYPAVYYYSVKNSPKVWGWFYENFDRPSVYRLVYPFRTLFNRLVGGGLLREMIHEHPDCIVSTHFMAAELFARAKRERRIQSKIITVITDFLPHSFWVNEGTDLYWVMGNEGREELERRGVPRERIHAGGIPVGRDFLPSGIKSTLHMKWGFKEDRLTLLFTSGSFGLGHQQQILSALEEFSDKIQCFVVCGNNHHLESALKHKKFNFPMHVFGFIDFMAELMEASDLILAKSGGATTTESLTKGVPMVVLDPIPGQETRNANILKERNAAFFMEKPDQIKLIIKAILENPELLKEKKQTILALAKPHAADDLVSYVLQEISEKNQECHSRESGNPLTDGSPPTRG